MLRIITNTLKRLGIEDIYTGEDSLEALKLFKKKELYNGL
jgi:hypothetical protein